MAANGKHGSALGERLRRERGEQGLSLRELARRLEVSPSLVSQIETGKIQPSVRTLYAIVSELGVSLDDVFAPEQGDGARRRKAQSTPEQGSGIVQRAADRSVIELESGVRWERLTTRNERDVEFLNAIYEPGGESAPADALVRHNGREFGIVLKGRLNVTVGFEEHELGPGDSIFFESTTPHRLRNEGGEPVEAIWVVLGRHGG
ncbi:MAG TPA: cupin domain-containing protein [Gaiellaceae bacterium]|nr:cupin domain-containing protein [Gaiellaceae bacterium]